MESHFETASSNLNEHRGGKPMVFDLDSIKPEFQKEVRK
jgi:hypothetical protein